MARPKTAATFTYADYLAWPEEERWELIEGQAYDMSPAPTRRHQELSKRIEYQIEHSGVYEPSGNIPVRAGEGLVIDLEPVFRP